VNDVVVAGRAHSGGDVIEVQQETHFPRHNVIRAGREDKNFKRTFFPAPPGTIPRAREAAWQAASRLLSSP
jgi:hypothetical protein